MIKIKKIKKEIIIVDDGSSDGTSKILKEEFLKKNSIKKIIFHKKNMGKGAAIKSAQKYINGRYVGIQDADLEYNPNDLAKIYNIIKNKNYDVVYGSRSLNKNVYKDSKNFSHMFRIFCNFSLTFISNKINNQNLTDAHTCYKVFKSEIFKNINLKEKGFAFCPEVTTKISKNGYQIKEIPISYLPRSYSDGKKINFWDGVEAVYSLIKYKLID